MGFQDVAFQSSRACGRDESLADTTCLKTVVGVSKVALPVKYLCSNKASFCVS